VNGELYWALIKLLVSLPLVLALAYFFLKYVLGRGSYFSPAGTRRMKVLEQLTLGPKAALSLVEVGGRYYLIAHHEGGISLLQELEELPGVLEGTAQGESTLDFGAILAGKFRLFSNNYMPGHPPGRRRAGGRGLSFAFRNIFRKKNKPGDNDEE